MTTELWRDIPEFPGYKVSSLGRIGSCFTQKGREQHGKWALGDEITCIRKPSYDRQGYARVNLWRDGKGHTMAVARLVMLAFHGLCPAGLEVCHADNDPSNDCLSNLRYDTHSANMQESTRSVARGRRKLTLGQAEAARVEYAGGDITQKALARKNSISQRSARDLLCGITYTDAGGPIFDLQEVQ